MADVFISYSKADRLLVEQLAAYLESEGWSVWWDRSITAGESFRDEIAKELARARAALVVWTQNSIGSDFVRAEAGRAKADAKLIPLKTAGIEYGDIPLPFGEMHTEPVENRELVRAAIVAQLTKPQVVSVGLLIAGASVRHAVLTWVGIIGCAITLFGNLKEVLELADWARLLVERWTEWTHTVWAWALGWIGIELPPGWSAVLTFSVFVAATILGGRLSMLSSRSPGLPAPSSKCAEFRINPAIVLIAAPLAGYMTIQLYESVLSFFGPLLGGDLVDVLFGSILVLAISAPIVGFARKRLAAAACSLLFIPIVFLLLLIPVMEAELNAGISIAVAYVAMGLLLGALAVVLILLPAGRVVQRFMFILVGFGILLGLNELSKLNLGQYF